MGLENDINMHGGAADTPKLAGPVLIVAGAGDNLSDDSEAQYRALLRVALADFCGTVVSGGTPSGILRARHRKATAGLFGAVAMLLDTRADDHLQEPL